MKKVILFTFVFLIGSTSCFARLGENVGEIERRYGRPITRYEKKDDVIVRKYSNGPFAISITFKEDRAAIISFKLRNGEKMSIKRINRLLRENGARADSKDADGYVEFSTWYIKPSKEKEGVVEFIDKPGKTLATYSLKKNVLIFKFASKR